MTSDILWATDCEECGSTSHILSWEEPEFCPICGRRTQAERKEEHLELSLDDD